jgi:hypothetical protein
MANYIGNGFSLQMIAPEIDVIIRRRPVCASDVPSDVYSIFGHADTARVVENMLGFPVPMNRESITLREGDKLYVAQIFGGRLPEGATQLPEGTKICFFEVSFEET